MVEDSCMNVFMKTLLIITKETNYWIEVIVFSCQNLCRSELQLHDGAYIEEDLLFNKSENISMFDRIKLYDHIFLLYAFCSLLPMGNLKIHHTVFS